MVSVLEHFTQPSMAAKLSNSQQPLTASYCEPLMHQIASQEMFKMQREIFLPRSSYSARSSVFHSCLPLLPLHTLLVPLLSALLIQVARFSGPCQWKKWSPIPEPYVLQSLPHQSFSHPSLIHPSINHQHPSDAKCAIPAFSPPIQSLQTIPRSTIFFHFSI